MKYDQNSYMNYTAYPGQMSNQTMYQYQGDPQYPSKNLRPAVFFENEDPMAVNQFHLSCIENQLNQVTSTMAYTHANVKTILEMQARYREEEVRRNSLQEYAYSQIYADAQGFKCFDKNGYPHLILQGELESSGAFSPDPMYRCPAFYLFRFKGMKDLLFVTESEMKKPDVLVQKLQGYLETTVSSIGGSYRKTYQLIQSYLIAAAGKTQVIPYYAGWTRDENDTWLYTKMNGISTHAMKAYGGDSKIQGIAFPKQIESRSATAMLQAAERTAHLMTAISSAEKRRLVFLVVHVASLYTLLSDLGYPVRIGIYFFSTSAKVKKILEGIFCWFQDEVISFSQSEDAFRRSVLRRKDQPMVVSNTQTGRDEQRTQQMLLDTLRSGCIPKTESSSIHALPVILGNLTNEIVTDPNMVTVELENCEISQEAMEWTEQQRSYLEEHLENFACYTAGHVDQLKSFLFRENNHFYDDDSGFEEQDQAALAIFVAVRKFVLEYFKSLDAPEQMYDIFYSLAEPQTDDTWRDLFLHGYRYADDSTSIAGRLWLAIRRGIKQGRIAFFDVKSGKKLRMVQFNDAKPVRVEGDPAACVPPKQPQKIYVEDSYLFVPRETFESLCKELDCSTPVTLKALEEKTILTGNRINANSYMVRKTVLDEAGARKNKSFYKLDITAIEMLSSY